MVGGGIRLYGVGPGEEVGGWSGQGGEVDGWWVVGRRGEGGEEDDVGF